jgi:Fungal chitosanase of glycosyl hydrolase group 75
MIDFYLMSRAGHGFWLRWRAMRRVSGLVLVGLLFSVSAVAWARQVSPSAVDQNSSHPSDHPSDQNISQVNLQHNAADCSPFPDAVHTAREAVEKDRRQLVAAVDSGGASATDAVGPFPSDLRQDLMVLQQREEVMNRCADAGNAPGSGHVAAAGCSGERILNFQMSHDGEPEREIPIWRLPGTTAFFYEAGMTIDADGAPNAYHPDNSGLDDLANAGAPGNWEGLAKDHDGEPFVQGPDDPFPGFYVSATALSDRTRPVNDPLRYVDASKIPYIVLPAGTARQLGARPGDFSVVLNQRNGKISYAIFGDVGPSDRIGEGSVALAENLGIRSNARNGGAGKGILFLIFPGSGNGRPRTTEEINSEGERLFQAWGGSYQLEACKAETPFRPFEGSRTTN